MRSIFISILVIFIFTGCVGTSPDVPNYQIKSVDKIGFIIKNRIMLHTHQGQMGFSNFEKLYPPLITDKEIANMLIKNVKVELVNLSNKDLTHFNYVIGEKDGKWVIKDIDLYKKLTEELGLKAVIVIEEHPAVISTPLGTTEAYTGLFSQHLIGINRYWAVSGISFRLLIFNPATIVNIKNKAAFIIVNDPLMSGFEKDSGFHTPKNIEILTDEELASLKKSILVITEINVLEINNYFDNNYEEER